jgi:outer membrane lipopolysaccharide assembly protein LptE/RlpB
MRLKLFKWLLFPAAALLAGGCYHIGANIMHPQIKTIAIAPVTNDTLEPYAAAIMRDLLTEQFTVDGALKVKSQGTADCILFCRITKSENTATGEDSTDGQQTYRAAEWAITVTADFSVIIPGRSAPLIPNRTVSGTAIYQVMTDMDTTRRRGLMMACRDAAIQMVQLTTWGW